MSCDGPHWGKYRGTVITSADMTFSGRLLCEVPAFPGMILNWATPCVPYAGFEQGLFAMPPTGADVWVEFENGDLDYPIWSGCFWGEGEIPVTPELGPLSAALVKVFKTPFCTVQLDDTPEVGGIKISVGEEAVAVPITLTMTSEGLTITTGPTTVLVNAETGVTITVAETVMTLDEETASVEAPTIELTAEEAINLESPAISVKGETDFTGGVAVEGAVEMTPAVAIEGALDVTGDTTLVGAVELTGPLAMEGAAEIAGALSVEGATNVVGFMGVEGDANVAGALTVEGDEAVAGIIEGVIVPPF